MSMGRLAALAAAFLFALPAWAAATAEEDAPVIGITPRYILQSMNGPAVMDSDFRGRFQLISFGYTFCPDICPTTLAEMAQILKQLGDDAPRVQALFISLDPERDTPDVLKSYTRFFDERILGLTGSPELVRRVAELFKVRYEKAREPGAPADQYGIDHSAGMYVLDPEGGFIVKFSPGASTAEVTARLRDLVAQSRSRPGPGNR